MKIALTGGGTGGHFYPIIAVAEEINALVSQEHLSDVELIYFSNEPYDEASLFEQHIGFVKIPAAKMALGGGIANYFRLPRVAWGVFVAVWKLFINFPDVVFGKGGYASFPTLVAARILGIPVIIHESDAVVTRTNSIVSKWAKRIAVSYAESAESFSAKVRKNIAHTGQPIRRQIRKSATVGAHEYLALEYDVPTVFIVGGSQGAQLINDAVWDVLPELLYKYQIIHQVGAANIDMINARFSSEHSDHELAGRYKPYGFLNALSYSMAAGAADIIVSRAGSSLFEIAAWEIPSIIIPRTNSVNNHNRINAYSYGRTGSCTVIEEANLTPHVLLSEIERILDNSEVSQSMKDATKLFHNDGAARHIAEEIIRLGNH